MATLVGYISMALGAAALGYFWGYAFTADLTRFEAALIVGGGFMLLANGIVMVRDD